MFALIVRVGLGLGALGLGALHLLGGSADLVSPAGAFCLLFAAVLRWPWPVPPKSFDFNNPPGYDEDPPEFEPERETDPPDQSDPPARAVPDVHILGGRPRPVGYPVPVLPPSIAELTAASPNTIIHAVIAALTPRAFEHFICILLAEMGYSKVSLIGGSGDLGVDVLAFNGQSLIIVQCKQQRAAVGPAPVRALVGAMMDFSAERAMFITSSHYSPGALEFATGKPIELLDGLALVNSARRYLLAAAPKEGAANDRP